MAKDPLLPAKPGEGDSWESLASNLLGINLNKSIDARSVSAEELEALELDLLDEPQLAAPGEPELSDPVSEESTGPGEVASAATETEPEPSDPYWDPLAAWEWDDAPASQPRATKPVAIEPLPETVPLAAAVEDSVVKSPGADARRAADSFDTVSDYREEYESDDWEFGAGLLEGVAPPESKKKSQPPAGAEKLTPEPASPSQHRGKDRPDERGERRRPQPRDERHEPREAERKPPDVRPRHEPAVPPPALPPARAAAEDDFGAGLVDDDLPPQSAPASAAGGDEERDVRRPRRRRRRGKSSSAEDRAGARRDDERSRETAGPAASSETENDFGDEPEADEDAHGESPYRNIPSWEEAIAYLINPRRTAEAAGESRSSERKETTSRSESTSGTGHNSGGRRRRRPPPR